MIMLPLVGLSLFTLRSMTHGHKNLKLAPTCFGLRPSSGSLHWSLSKIIFRLKFSKKNYVVICYAVVWQHVIGMVSVFCWQHIIGMVCVLLAAYHRYGMCSVGSIS